MIWALCSAHAAPVALVSHSADSSEVAASRVVTSPDGAFAVVTAEGVWLPPQGDSAPVQIEQAEVYFADVSNTGSVALAHVGGITVHGADGAEVLRLAGYNQTTGLSLSPDGRYLAVASPQSVALHDALDGRLRWRSNGASTGVTFRPDGKRVIAGIDGINRLYYAHNGRTVARFGSAASAEFHWTDAHLWTITAEGVAEAWDRAKYTAVEEATAQGFPGPAVEHPTDGWAFRDGCVAGGRLCPVPDSVGAAFGADGALWIAGQETLSRWEVTAAGAVVRLSGVPDGVRISGIATDDVDVVLATEEGRLLRVGADGALQHDAAISGCVGACATRAVGAERGGAWALGPDGSFTELDRNGQVVGRPRPSNMISAGRLADGLWVSLGSDGRTRVGPKPGKGKPTVQLSGARGVAVGPSGFAVFGETVTLFNATGLSIANPPLGPGRSAAQTVWSPKGGAVAVIDDQGSLHRYGTDGRAAYRAQHGLPPNAPLAWSADGATIAVGGPELRLFDAASGEEHGRVALAGGGEVTALVGGGPGFLAVQQGEDRQQVLRVDVASLFPREDDGGGG